MLTHRFLQITKLYKKETYNDLSLTTQTSKIQIICMNQTKVVKSYNFQFLSYQFDFKNWSLDSSDYLLKEISA